MTKTHVTVCSSYSSCKGWKEKSKSFNCSSELFFLYVFVILQVELMVENIGFPNYIVDDKLIDEKYKNVSENTLFSQTQ